MILIYTLSDPQTKQIRYVGKTNQSLNKRLGTHIGDAKVKRYRNHNCNWIQSLLAKGVEPKIELLDSIEDTSDWEWLEQYWIAQLKSWNFNLNNLTIGGDGNKGQVFSAESIAKRTVKLIGQRRTEEFKQRHSILLKGKPKSTIAKANIRAIVIKNQGRPIVQLDLKTGIFIKEWPCIVDAALHYNVDRSSIGRCCKGQFKHSVNYKWKYKEDYTNLKI